MGKKNAFYAQSGGSTAVINATAAALIQRSRQPDAQAQIEKLYIGHNGILGALRESLLDSAAYNEAMLERLCFTPGSAFGSCRYKLKTHESNPEDYARLLAVFDAHNIGYFFYNGGGDSQDTAHKVANYFKEKGYPIQCIGIPKTIDNDLPFTDCCPGYASSAKYLAVTAQEISLELAGMCNTSTQVFVLETMGRHTGWLAAGCAYGLTHDEPAVVLFPEVAFDSDAFLARVDERVKQQGRCLVIASEGIKDAEGRLLCNSRLFDAFGHVQLGGIAPNLATMVSHHLGYKYHWAMPDYMQRAARHLVSATDHAHAMALGEAAIEAALQGQDGIMLSIERTQQHPYQWRIGNVDLAKVANQEKMMPLHFIDKDQHSISQECRDYLSPLLTGEVYPPYQGGLPHYIQLPQAFASPHCPTYE